VSGAAAPSSQQPDRQGFLYEVSVPEGRFQNLPAGARLVLFGTIHVDRSGARVLNAQSTRELEGAQRVALEADPRDAQTVARLARQYGYYADGDLLDHHVPAADVLAAREILLDEGASLVGVTQTKPWLMSFVLTSAKLAHDGFSATMGSEWTLATFAAQRSIPIVEIEGFESQFSLFDHQSADLQRAQLEESINEIRSGELVDETRALVRAWHAADGDTLRTQLTAMEHDQAPFGRFTIEQLINMRDRSMADRAEEYLRQGGTTFFAVGCLHLFGDAGLVAELARRGYRVRDLQAS
jgi:uncharacterized protein YbaP (TraB family)